MQQYQLCVGVVNNLIGATIVGQGDWGFYLASLSRFCLYVKGVWGAGVGDHAGMREMMTNENP